MQDGDVLPTRESKRAPRALLFWTAMPRVFETEPTNLATMKFGISDDAGAQVSTSHPYYKWTWTATFEFDSGASSATDDDTSQGQTAKDVNDITLKTFELPRWTTDVQVVNQYNHKTIVQTKLNYEPITISFYDQQNDAVDKLIWDFVKGQFDPNDASKKGEIKPLTVVVKMHRHSAGELESKPKTYTLGKAYIVDAQHDTLDYSTSDVVLWTITLRYETLETEDFAGEPPKQSTGIAAKEKTPGKTLPAPATPSKPAPAATPPVEPIPDASPSLLDLELGNTGTINYNPTGLAQVLDQQRSRARPTRETPPPGPLSGDTGYGYTGYESAFIPTVPGLNGADVGSPSTGANGTRPAPTNNRVDRTTAVNNSTVKVERQGNTTRITETRELTGEEARQARNELDRRMADSRARRLGYPDDAAYQRARANNLRTLDRRTGNDF